MNYLYLFTTFLRLLIIFVGGTISYRTLRVAFLDEDNRKSFLALGSGFVLFTIGMTIEGLLELFLIPQMKIHIFESIFVILGFFCIIYAIRRISLDD